MSNIFYNGFTGGHAGIKSICTIVVSGEEIEDFVLSDETVTTELSNQITELLHHHGHEGVDTVSTTFDLNERRICLELSLVPDDRITSILEQIQVKSFGTCQPFDSFEHNQFMERFNLKPSHLIVARVAALPDLRGLTDD